MGGGGLSDGKKVVKYTFIILIVASFIAYLLEFIFDQTGRYGANGHRGSIGYIFIFVFILIFLIIGLVGGIIDNAICTLVFCIGFLIMVIVDALFIGAIFAVVIGALTLILGAVFTYMNWK